MTITDIKIKNKNKNTYAQNSIKYYPNGLNFQKT